MYILKARTDICQDSNSIPASFLGELVQVRVQQCAGTGPLLAQSMTYQNARVLEISPTSDLYQNYIHALLGEKCFQNKKGRIL
jgi:hypothetical protein